VIPSKGAGLLKKFSILEGTVDRNVVFTQAVSKGRLERVWIWPEVKEDDTYNIYFKYTKR